MWMLNVGEPGLWFYSGAVWKAWRQKLDLDFWFYSGFKMHHNALFPALFRQRHNAVKTYVPTTFYPTTSHHYKIKKMSKQFPVISSPSQCHQPIPSHPKPTVESSIANPAESWFYRGHEGANRTGDQERDLATIKSQNFQTFPNNLFPNNFQSFPIIFQSFPVCLNMSRLFSIIRIPNLSSGILSRKLIL